MHKYVLKWFMLFVFIFLPLCGYAQQPDTDEIMSFFEPSLRVGILTNQQSVQVSADANFDLVSAGTGRVLGSFRAKDIATLTIINGQMTINGQPTTAAGVDITIKKDESLFYVEQYIQVNKRRYRGDISIRSAIGKSGMTVVNTLPIEQYLYGIIKNEISPEWALEAVKAQAVAARTYALASSNKHKADGFDVCATTDCQVYGGRESETPRALEAVDATRGLIMLYNGKLITAYFHSSSGGYTENSENVWSASLPYLRGVVDYDQNCQYFKWEKKLTAAEVNQAISKAGYNIGPLQAIELSPLTTPPVASFDRGVSGRVKSVRLIGTNGSVLVSGEKLRRMWDLKSTLFDINTFAKVYKKVAAPVIGESTDFISITGFGWGHGVGMSQWGAKAMAEKAPPENPEYFKDILKHYYQGIQIKKAYL